MVGHGVRTGKYRAGLAVHTLAVTKEQTLAGRVVLVEDTSLAYEALIHQRRVADRHTAADDEVGALDARTQFDGSGGVGLHRTVLQSADAREHGMVADAGVLDRSAVEDAHVLAYLAHRGALTIGVLVNHPFQRADQCRTVTVERHDVCQAGGKAVEDRYLTSPTLVHHGYAYAITECRLTVHEDSVDILDTRTASDAVVGDIVVDIVESHIVAQLYVVEHGVVDAGIYGDATGQFECALKATHLDGTGEAHLAYAVGRETFAYQHLAPVLRIAALLTQLLLLDIG